MLGGLGALALLDSSLPLASCGGGGSSPASSAPPTSSPAPPSGSTPVPPPPAPGPQQPPAGQELAAFPMGWEIGPVIDGKNYSVGVPLHPTQTPDGWAF